MARKQFKARTAKSITSKSLKQKKSPFFAQEAFVLMRGFLLPQDKGKGKKRFVGFSRDTRVVALIREQAKKDLKRRKVGKGKPKKGLVVLK